MRILVLGGTADARYLADHLIESGIEVIYSVAGLVRVPKMTCEVLVGGFSQFGGLSQYLRDRQQSQPIDMILDVTHPYAEKMSNQAVLSAAEVGLPCWRFYRPAWEPQKGDLWQAYHAESELYSLLQQDHDQRKRLLLSAGQISEQTLMELASLPFEQIYLRTAVEPAYSLASEGLGKVSWLKAIGPFSYADEDVLINKLGIDVLVSKNSGGESTYAKIEVARERGIPVLMLSRPTLAPATKEFVQRDACFSAIKQYQTREKTNYV